jgi:DNA-binding transcriptional LysR family regulator
MRNGRLVEVMPEWRFPTRDLSLVHLSNGNMPRPIRLFTEFVARMAPTLFQDLPA